MLKIQKKGKSKQSISKAILEEIKSAENIQVFTNIDLGRYVKNRWK